MRLLNNTDRHELRESLFDGVIRVWLEFQTPQLGLVNDFLAEQGLTHAAPIDTMNDGFTHLCHVSIFEDYHTQFQDTHPDTDPGESWLLLALALRLLPHEETDSLDDFIETDHREPSAWDAWFDMLPTLENLDDAPPFVAYARQLVDRSAAYRSKSFSALLENTRKLSEDASLCAFFASEFDCNALNPYSVAPDQYQEVARFIRDLTRAMRAYYELVNQGGILITAEKAREEELEALLGEELPRLNSVMRADVPPFPPPPTLKHAPFREWTATLYDMEPDAEAFEDLTAFLNALEAKVSKRQNKPITLEAILERLRQLTPPERSLLGVVEADRWQVPDHPLTDKQRQAMEEALGLFARYITLNTRTAASFAERRQQKAEIDALRPRIRAAAGIFRGVYERAGQQPAETDAPTPNNETEADPLMSAEIDTVITANAAAVAPSMAPPTPSEQVHQRIPRDEVDLAAIARYLEPDHEEEQDWHAFLWALIEYGDLSGAYWLAKSLESSASFSTPLATDLIGAVQGAQWLSVASDTYVQDLQQTAKRYQPDPDNPVQSMLGVAAALPSLLIAPYSGLYDWLHTPTACQPLHRTVEAVRQLANNRVALQPAIVATVSGQAQQENSIESVCADAQFWLENARNERNRFKRAEVLWRKLSTPGGWLYEQMVIVAENRVNQRGILREAMKLLQSERQIEGFIEERDVKKRASGAIVGAALEQLKRDVQDAVNLAGRWDKLVTYQQQAANNGQDWQVENVRRLRDALQADKAEIHDTLDDMLQLTNPRKIRAAAYNLKQSVLLLQQTLAIPDAPPTLGWAPVHTDVFDLYDAFRYRLLFLPELTLNDKRKPVQANGKPAFEQIREPLRVSIAEERNLYQAGHLWMQAPSYDFRFTDDISNMLPNADDANDLADRAHRDRIGLREGLRQELEIRKADIERAMLNGTIHDARRTELFGTLESINLDEVVDFGAVYEHLEGIEQKLKESRYDRLSNLQDRWQNSLEPRLEATQYRLQPGQLDGVKARVMALMEKEDARLLDEYFSQLESYLQGHDLDLRWFNGGAEADETSHVLEDYLAAREVIEEALQLGGTRPLRQQIQEGETAAGFDYAQLAMPRRDEAVIALKAWEFMKARGLQNFDSNPKKLHDLMTFIGFTFPSEDEADIQLHGHSTDWVYYEIRASASELLNRPIPTFGSQARHLYHVVCVWDRPNADTLSAMLHDLSLDRHSVIIFYFGRMQRARWEYLLDVSREREMTMAIMDEILLVYLTQRGQLRSRFPDFLCCTLPFANAMPYTPYQPGDVPTEMFFGREDIARKLQSKEGGTILYGGRQLGKSALLRHVKRRFHKPDAKAYAWVEDIKLIGEHGQPADLLWERLLKGFRANHLLSEDVPFTTSEDAQAQIEAVMATDRRRRVLVMFDEADNFLERDAAGSPSFAVVDRLRQMMVNTEYQFKVVFAGLHNVQRFQSSPNQPLAHFGQPMNIGPLKAIPAQSLVREPLEALGYRIREETVLRILSYTNYHPGLIQIFCHELLKILRSRAGNAWPPYQIRREDIETVYLRPDVRDQIRDRFGLTLALDKRYKVITLALIVDQMEPRDRFDGKYYAANIEELARYWWQRGFEGVNSDHFQGLLNEMCGLGILVRDLDGLYRLRSPNLVRLMGNKPEIENLLIGLSETPLPDETALETIHVPLNDTGTQYSPLNRAQERTINNVTHGLIVIAATEANGLIDLPHAIQAMTPRTAGRNRVRFHVVPTEDLKTADMVARYVREAHAAAAPEDYTVMYVHPVGTVERYIGDLLENLVNLSWKQTHADTFRVIVTLPPRALLEWVRTRPTAHREEVRAYLAAFVVCHPWTKTAIQRRLYHLELLDDPERLSEIQAATGGWHALVMDYLQAWQTHLAQNGKPNWVFPQVDILPEELLAGFGLNGHEALIPILKLVQMGATRAEVTPPNLAELVGYSGISPEMCEALVDYLLLTTILREDHDNQLQLAPLVPEIIA